MQNAKDITKDEITESKGSADMKEHLGEKFIIHSVETQTSKYGLMMFAEISDEENSEKGRLFIRGAKPVERLTLINSKNQFPVEATFISKNGAYDIV